ncbi:MAG: hypothetical protein KC900_06875 [Candidatus Omnitrophica bacterium]|nr:hypothetical protein [Candidatus Omnitrophota bacterium]
MKSFIPTIVLGLALAGAGPVAAEIQSYDYQTQNPRTREDINAYTVKIEPLPDGRRKYSRTIVGDDEEVDKYEDFILDENFDTVEWTNKGGDGSTSYTGKKNGRTIILKGTLDGEPLDKTIELEDDRPFYFSPKFNLQKLILSGESKTEFWTLRKDKLTPYLMEAQRDGTKRMKIMGEEIEAVEVKYNPTGKFARYYRRTYFYRPSDGLFVYRKSPTGSVTRLVGP